MELLRHVQVPVNSIIRFDGQRAKVNWQQGKLLGLSYLDEPYYPGSSVAMLEEIELVEPTTVSNVAQILDEILG